MKILRYILLLAVALGLILLAVLTWGSLGSAVCVFCLITMAAGLLVKRFLVEREDSDYDMEG